ncbi:MAG: permease [Bacilli bacterium]|nr:permease [Bacilli bacterium]
MIKNISTIFMSIFFESLPFLLLGSLISAIIETYISNERMAKLIPKNKFLGSIVGVLLGFFLPACDCAVIPVSKRLLKKKVPINVAISFMLASPIINPVVLLSTYYAFYKTDPKIFWYRLLFGIVVALVIGTIMGIIFKDQDVTTNNSDKECACEHCDHDHHEKESNFVKIIKHTALDLFDVVKFLMFGALIASLIQVIVPRSVITTFNNNNILSIIVLMVFAYLISLCSTSDSFVGKSLLSSFTESSIVAYLLLGPMIDIKNTFVLLGNYKKKFVVTLISLIFIVIFIISALVVNIL